MARPSSYPTRRWSMSPRDTIGREDIRGDGLARLAWRGIFVTTCEPNQLVLPRLVPEDEPLSRRRGNDQGQSRGWHARVERRPCPDHRVIKDSFNRTCSPMDDVSRSKSNGIRSWKAARVGWVEHSDSQSAAARESTRHAIGCYAIRCCSIASKEVRND